MSTIVVTGANAGLGFEACKQLAALPDGEVGKIIITCRSAAKAEATIKTLAELSNKPLGFFGSVLMDLHNYDSVVAAAKAMPHQVDRICLNAGAVGDGMHKIGVTDAFASTLGHALLIDLMLKAGNFPKGSRIVYIGSELARRLWAFTGFFPGIPADFSEKDIEPAITEDTPRWLAIRRQLQSYGNTKLIGHLYFAHVARENPELNVVITSPGATLVGSEFVKNAKFPMNFFGTVFPSFFWCLGVSHGVEEGGKRYVETLTGAEPKWSSGSMPMSGNGSPCCCLPLCAWGARGPMVDNRSYRGYFRDADLHEKTASAVRAWFDTWAKTSSTADSDSANLTWQQAATTPTADSIVRP